MQLVGLMSRIPYTDYQYIGLFDLRLSQRGQKINRRGSVRKSNIHERSRYYRRNGKSVSIKYYECVCVRACVRARVCVSP